jgi:peptidoglycan/LPS O-acetylase OafA/YrhL
VKTEQPKAKLRICRRLHRLVSLSTKRTLQLNTDRKGTNQGLRFLAPSLKRRGAQGERQMKSTEGQHWLALDHIRAAAAFLVFSWHFFHWETGVPIPFEGAPQLFPLALLDEGHTGVSLFMVLSGYLFAKLLTGKEIKYWPFFVNRFLRLAPLLIVTMIIVGVYFFLKNKDMIAYAKDIAFGIVKPTWPNGGWSITAEIHFYIVLPLILMITKRNIYFSIAILVMMNFIRMAAFFQIGQVQDLSYWTIIGRIDQFLLGIFAFQIGPILRGRHYVIMGMGLAFTAFYWWFDAAGGFTKLAGASPSPSPIWIIMPTIEGLFYAALTSYYDSTYRPNNEGLSWFIGKLGQYSYSIYLLHFFVVFVASKIIQKYIMVIDNYYEATAWSILLFSAMAPIGYLSFKFIEEPFLKNRRKYVSS